MQSEYLDSQRYKIIARWSSLSLPFSIRNFQTHVEVKRSRARKGHKRKVFTPFDLITGKRNLHPHDASKTTGLWIDRSPFFPLPHPVFVFHCVRPRWIGQKK
jgi:hypothetical protein